MTRFLLILLLSVFLSGLVPMDASATDPDFGLDADEAAALRANDAETEANIRRDGLSEFRFVRDPSSVPPRMNVRGPFVDVSIPIDPRLAALIRSGHTPPLIATLHDVKTGAPQQSCAAPCTLQRPERETAFLLLYRFGGHIQFLELPTQDTYLPVVLSRMASAFNAVDDAMKHDACMMLAEKRRSEVSADAKLCFATLAPLPPAARRSGHCIVGFDVAADGRPENVWPRECTEAHFCTSSYMSVSTSHYLPKVELRAFVPQTDLTTTVEFTVKDQFDNLLPKPEGALVPCGFEMLEYMYDGPAGELTEELRGLAEELPR